MRNYGCVPKFIASAETLYNFIFRNKFITVFLRLNLGNLGELLIFQIDCIESPTYRHAIIISEINLFI